MGIRHWFERTRLSAEEQELQALQNGLNTPPAALPLADLFPVFVPASFLDAGNWPGPYELYEVPGLVLTWVVLQPKQTMRYVDHSVVSFWEGTGTLWRERARQNLLRSASETPFTHEFRRDDDSVYAVGLMQEDGIGPSRLLATPEIEAVLPEGYLVGLPEMSCGLALSITASEAERSKLEGIVDSCFSKGTRPLVPGLHPASSLRPRAAA